MADPEPERRAAAAFAFGLASEHRAVPALLRGTADADFRMRTACLRALGLLGAVEATAAMEDAARNDPSPEVRDEAKIALQIAQIDAPDLTTRLIRGLSSAQPDVRLVSINLLAALDEKSAIPALRPLLDDEEELIRDSARTTIKRLDER
jgi:HEAT repeat protein